MLRKVWEERADWHDDLDRATSPPNDASVDLGSWALPRRTSACIMYSRDSQPQVRANAPPYVVDHDAGFRLVREAQLP